MQGQLILDSVLASTNLAIGLGVWSVVRWIGALNIGFALYNVLSFVRHMI